MEQKLVDSSRQNKSSKPLEKSTFCFKINKTHNFQGNLSMDCGLCTINQIWLWRCKKSVVNEAMTFFNSSLTWEWTLGEWWDFDNQVTSELLSTLSTASNKKTPFWKIQKLFFMDLRFRNWTYIQTSFRLKNHHATSSSQARCICRVFVNQISTSCCNNNEKIRYLFLSTYSLSIAHLFHKKKFFRFVIIVMTADENQIH